jgi:RAT1-interacting protein
MKNIEQSMNSLSFERFTFDFVTWRGTLRKIMSSLFNNETDWRIGVIRYRSAYFLHVFHTETELNIESSQTSVEKRMCYWGHKFEDYLCSGR